MLHGLAAICHEAGNAGYIGSHCPKQSHASSLLGGEFLASVAREVELEVTTYRLLPTGHYPLLSASCLSFGRRHWHRQAKR